MTKLDKFETKTCSRCSGTGEYSWNAMDGTRCFKCRGAKLVYTKRGVAAKVYFENLLSIPAKDIQPGMKVRALRITNGGMIAGEKWSLVERIDDNSITKRAGRIIDGIIIYDGINIISKEVDFIAVKPETIYRVAATADQKQAAFQKALDYQATLTKAGKPRK